MIEESTAKGDPPRNPTLPVTTAFLSLFFASRTWEMNRHSFTDERGDYRFSDLDRSRSYAIGIEFSDTSQWKLVPHRTDREPANEDFATLIDRRNLRVDRKDFRTFVEVPEDLENVAPRIHLVVERET